MPLGTEVGLGSSDFVIDGTSYPQKKGTPTPTQFLAHVYCSQTAGWMKMPLGTEVDLGPGHIVSLLDGIPALRERGIAAPALFGHRFVSLGTPINFNGFRVLASLLQRRGSTEANQTFHNVWPLHGQVNYIYIFGGCCSVMEFWQVQNSLCVLQVLRCPIGSVTARQSSSGRETSQTLRR